MAAKKGKPTKKNSKKKTSKKKNSTRKSNPIAIDRFDERKFQIERAKDTLFEADKIKKDKPMMREVKKLVKQEQVTATKLLRTL